MGFTEESDFWGGGGGVTKIQYTEEGLPKNGGLGQFADFRGGGGAGEKEGVGVFERGGWYPNAHYGKKN